MATAALDHVQLARNLPIKLQRFFAANPPQALAAAPHSRAADSKDPSTSQASKSGSRLNPFTPHKDPRSGRWHPPIYSLRRQADLVKLARTHGVEGLLPYSPKLTEERQKRRDEHSARIQGIGEGKKPKGHMWERTLKSRLETRRKAMLEMPKMIQDWKQVYCHAAASSCHKLLTVHSVVMVVAGRSGRSELAVSLYLWFEHLKRAICTNIHWSCHLGDSPAMWLVAVLPHAHNALHSSDLCDFS